MRPTVLLTGGFGNLGGRIAAALHESGNWNIRLASRTMRQAPLWAPNAKVVQIDLINNLGIEEACKNTSLIIHLAALNDREAVANPDMAEAVSGKGTQLLSEAAARANTKHFVFMSTAHVYGSPLVGKFSETSDTKCTHPYATSHLSGENAVAQFHQRGDFLGIRLRCANGYGFPQDKSANVWHALVNDLCKQAVELGSINLQTSGIQQRNFIPISDICTSIPHLVQLDQASLGDGLFNLGIEKSASVFEMATYIAHRSQALLGIDPPISRPQVTAQDNDSDLDFQINKLKLSGFTPMNDIDFEIDNLLRLCQDTRI
jgi:UDP-glucose 4-epimerase